MTDENFMLYQRFIFKLSNWKAITFLMITFEYSLVGLGALLLAYIRGNYISLGIQTPPPVYPIFVITSGYTFLKLCWLLFLFMRARRELYVWNQLLIMDSS